MSRSRLSFDCGKSNYMKIFCTSKPKEGKADDSVYVHSTCNMGGSLFVLTNNIVRTFHYLVALNSTRNRKEEEDKRKKGSK